MVLTQPLALLCFGMLQQRQQQGELQDLHSHQWLVQTQLWLRHCFALGIQRLQQRLNEQLDQPQHQPRLGM